MKRSALLFGALMLGAASAANAQGLTMQMSNGWNFSFAGNVNAFWIYSHSKDAAGNTTGNDLSFGTGLLPAFATFEAKGKEGNTDLGVHFGFAPQVEFGGHNASYFGTDAAGAQIDMRQVYLTAGGSWGTLTMGKELGLYQRGNILTDATLLGVGVGGGGRGTALGRIGYGYLYTDFRPQLTYSTVAGKPAQFNIGIFDALRVGSFTYAQLPRLEAELNYSSGNVKVFVNGAAQTMKDAPSGGNSLTSAGVGGGLVFSSSGFSVTASGFFASGMGYLLQGDGIVGGANFDNEGVDGTNSARKSFGYIGQLAYNPSGSSWIIAGSFGENHLKQTDADKTASGSSASDGLKNRAIVGQITYKWTKSLRWVGEFGYVQNYVLGTEVNKTTQGSIGMMLFF